MESYRKKTKREESMTKKLYGLISTLVTCAGTASSAIVGYLQPANYGAWVAAIMLVAGTINDVLLLFVKPEEK